MFNCPTVWDGDDLVEALNDAIDEANTFTDEYGVEMARIPVRGSSDNGGRLLLEHLEIIYDVDLVVENPAVLNSFYRASNNSADKGLDEASPVLGVEGGSTGGIVLKNLMVITADADLEMSAITVENEGSLKEGSAVEMSVEVTNTGTGERPAEVEVIFWWSEDGAGEPGLGKTIDDIYQEVPTDGDPVLYEATWDDPPAGEYYLHARIVDSTPEDVSGNANDEQKQVTIASGTVIITVQDVELSDEAVEDSEVQVTVTLGNSGEKDGDVDLQVYLDSSVGKEIYHTQGLTVEAGESYDVIFQWTVEQADSLFIEWQEADGGSGDHDYTDLEVMALPDFELVNLTWEPLAIADNTDVTFEMEWLNSGDIDVSVTVELELRKGDDRELIIFKVGELFTGGQSRLFPKSYTFRSADGVFAPLTGEYTLEARIHTIEPISGERVWEETLAFSDASRVLDVTSPPELEVSGLTLPSSVNENTDIDVDVTIDNHGDSTATFTLELYVYLEGKSASTPIRSPEFEIPGGGSETFTIPYHVPEDQVGKYVFKARITGVLPVEGGDDPEEDNEGEEVVDIHGSVDTPDEDDGGFPMALLAAVIVLLLVGMGAFGYYLIRSSDNEATKAPDEPGAPGTPEAPASAPAPETTPPPTPQGASPPPPATGEIAGAGAGTEPPATPDTAPTPGSVNVTCPKCSTRVLVTDTSRPLTVRCSGCNTNLRLE